MSRSRFGLLVAGLTLVFGCSLASGQFTGLPPERLALRDLSDFNDAPSNWSLADSVWADPDRTRHLVSTDGSGVLVNQPTEENAGHLFTSWEHGDLELEMDVLVPNGSNSGIYLQGRYEIQILDSWGVPTLTFADMGGIYQRWRPDRPEGERGIGGRPPRFQTAKAPGLWQHVEIDFRAPRFGPDGEKVENARFEKVTLNGVVVHRNVEVTGPTRAAAFEDEARRGPLMIQGDHGPVAVKNLRYKRYRPGRAAVTDVSYRVYEGSWDEGLDLDADLDTASVSRAGSSNGLTRRSVQADDDFAVVHAGTLEVPRSGAYAFELVLDWIVGDPHFSDQAVGGGALQIDGTRVLGHDGSSRTADGSVDLEAGTHSFRLTYFKNRPGDPGVGLFVEGPAVRRHELTGERSLREDAPSDPILVEPDARPRMVRSFFEHGAEKRTHVIAVGDSRGAHYAYDLDVGSLLRVWKGPFLRTNSMWEGRGFEQRAVPRGSGPVFEGAPLAARLADPSSVWPDSVQEGLSHEYLGYRLDDRGVPGFRYRIGGLELEDRLRADTTGGRLVRSIRVEGAPTTSGVYLRLAVSDRLRSESPGRWVVGDRSYYIDRLEAGPSEWITRRQDGTRELLVPVAADQLPVEVRYAIVW